ncbi:MAG: hypothetical protein ACT4PM_09885 [Gemmatimonadales bacterium]
MRRTAMLLAGLLLGTAYAAPTHAQQLTVGGFVGQVYDTSEDWLLFGGEVRWQVKEDKPFVVQPRVWINPYEGGSALGFDGNVLYRPNYDGKFRLYAGVGGAVVRQSFEGGSETDVGLNFAAGFELVLNEESKLRPFLHSQYTVINDSGNPFTLSAGVAFRLK